MHHKHRIFPYSCLVLVLLPVFLKHKISDKDKNHRADVPKNGLRQRMSKVWDKIYKSDSAFFGDEPSHFANLCLSEMKANNVKKLLELGAGHGRDSIFFGSNGIKVEALDYSNAGVQIILNRAKKEKELQLNSQTFDVRNALPFPNNYFDAVYSHMFFNMKFSPDELSFII